MSKPSWPLLFQKTLFLGHNPRDHEEHLRLGDRHGRNPLDHHEDRLRLGDRHGSRGGKL